MLKQTIKISLSFTLLFCSLVSFGQTPFDPTNPKSSAAGVDNLVGGYGVDQLQAPPKGPPTGLFAPTADTVYNQLIGAVLNQVLPQKTAGTPATNPNFQPGGNAPQTLTGQAIYTLLTTTDPNKVESTLLKVPAAAPSPGGQQNKTGFFAKIFGGGSSAGSPGEELTQNFDLNALVQPLAYDISQSGASNPSGAQGSSSAERTAALHFITFASGMAQPMQVLDMSKVDQDKLNNALANSTDLQNYLIALRSLVAQQSVGISNLYQLYAERVAVDTSKVRENLPNMPNTPVVPKASPLMIDNYVATRRFGPDWETTLQTVATPAEISRQQAYILREILLELYKNRVTNERILATLSVMELQNTGGQQLALQQLYRKVASEPPFGTGNSIIPTQ
ncbi:MAG: hypothetical protein AB7F64_09235 [Gammaproteobacteria bacterium]